MPEIVTAFGGTEALQAFPEYRPARVDAATAGRTDGRTVFLTVMSRAYPARQIVARLAGVPCPSFNSTSVRSGCSAINAVKVCRCGSSYYRYTYFSPPQN